MRCGYHGLKFDAAGRCVDAPGLDRIPPQARVKTYPVAVRNKWVFVWMGDPARAEERLLPDNFSNDHPDWRNKPGYLHYDTPYLLICDNLLDFSHLTYVHEKTLGGSTAIAQARPEIEALRARHARHAPRARRAAAAVLPEHPHVQRHRGPLVHLRLPAFPARC